MLRLPKKQKGLYCLIQESYLKSVDVHRFQNRYFKVISASSAFNKTKGVLIVIKCNSVFSIIRTGGDTEGRITYAVVSLNNTNYAFMSIYAPTEGDSYFFQELLILEKRIMAKSSLP